MNASISAKRRRLAPQGLDAVRPCDQGERGETEKQTMLDHAGNGGERSSQPLGIGDRAERAVEDEMAAVGDEVAVAAAKPDRARQSQRR